MQGPGRRDVQLRVPQIAGLVCIICSTGRWDVQLGVAHKVVLILIIIVQAGGMYSLGYLK